MAYASTWRPAQLSSLIRFELRWKLSLATGNVVSTKGITLKKLNFLLMLLSCTAIVGCPAEKQVESACKYSRVTTVENRDGKTTVTECLPDPAEVAALLEKEELKKQAAFQAALAEPVCVQVIDGKTTFFPKEDCEK